MQLDARLLQLLLFHKHIGIEDDHCCMASDLVFIAQWLMKKRSDIRKHCALDVVRQSQKISHCHRPPYWGTGIRGLMRGMATLPQGNQELLVVRDKVGRPPGELGVSNSMECDIFHSVLWHCWLGDRKGIRPIKNWILVCWWWWFDWSFARLIAPVTELSPSLPSSFASINTG